VRGVVKGRRWSVRFIRAGHDSHKKIVRHRVGSVWPEGCDVMSFFHLFSNSNNWRSLCSAACALALCSTAALAQETSQPAASAPAPDLASMDIEALMNIEVTSASRFTDKLSEAPSIMSVVTSDELRRFGGMTLGEILQRVTGLTGTSQFFTDRSMVAARGDQTKTAGGHILFLINGRPTREVQEGGIISDLLESFPVEIIDRIEVIRGPGSVLYGSNAFSAVINLITEKAKNNQATVEALDGADGAVASSTQLMYKRGNLSAVGAAQLHDAPDWPVTYVDPISVRNLPFAPQVPITQHVTVVDRGVGSYLGVNYKGFSFMSAFTEWQSTSFVTGAVGETRLTRDFANLGYDHKATQNWDMNFNVTFTRTTFNEAAYAPYVTRDSKELVAEWTNLVTLTNRDRLTVGALFNRIAGEEKDTTTVPNAISAQGSRPAGAFYAQLDHELRHDLKLIGGFQSNKIGDIALDTVPRGGIVWNPSSWVSIKALYGQAFRAPALDELLLKLQGIVGNPNLKPEKVGTFDLGIGFQGRRVEAGVDYFHSKQTDSIVTAPGIPIRYVNLGQLTFDGVELEGKYYFRKDFFLQGSMLFQTNVDGSGRNDVTPIPNIGFKGGVSYEDRGLSASLFEVSDGKIDGYANSVNPVQGTHNILNGQLRYDLSRFLHLSDRNNIAFVVHANNLTDFRVWLPGWGVESGDTVPVEQGRVIYAGIQFSVGKK
jgi:outer membrane receptor for ferrienterochelin and colicins